MSERSVSKAEAGRVAMLAQGVAIGLFGAAGAVLLLGLPVGEPRGAELVDVEQEIQDRIALRNTPTNANDDAGFATLSPDYDGMTARLKAAGGIPDPEPEATSDVSSQGEPRRNEKGQLIDGQGNVIDDPSNPAEPESGPPPAPVTYLGMIDEGQNRVALVKLDQTQRFLRQGATVTFEAPVDPEAGREEPENVEVAILSIEADEITVRDPSGERVIAKASRTGPVVTTALTRNANSGRALSEAERKAADHRRRLDQFEENTRSADMIAQISQQRQKLIERRPKRETFTAPDGSVNQEAYRNALREWSEALRELSRQIPAQGSEAGDPRDRTPRQEAEAQRSRSKSNTGPNFRTSTDR